MGHTPRLTQGRSLTGATRALLRTWRLTDEEVRKLLLSRSDFEATEVRKVLNSVFPLGEISVSGRVPVVLFPFSFKFAFLSFPSVFSL